MMYSNNKKTNLFFKPVFMVGVCIVALFILNTDFKQLKSDRYFNQLGKTQGFTKLYNKNFPEQMAAKNTFNIMKQNILIGTNKSLGYKIQKEYDSRSSFLKQYDNVQIHDLNDNYICSAEYGGHWTNGASDGYHIVMVSSPESWLYQQEYLIDLNNVLIKKN